MKFRDLAIGVILGVIATFALTRLSRITEESQQVEAQLVAANERLETEKENLNTTEQIIAGLNSNIARLESELQSIKDSEEYQLSTEEIKSRKQKEIDRQLAQQKKGGAGNKMSYRRKYFLNHGMYPEQYPIYLARKAEREELIFQRRLQWRAATPPRFFYFYIRRCRWW